MKNSEIFKKSGLSICAFDEQSGEFLELTESDHEIIFDVLDSADRLSATEKILILAGITVCGECEEK